MPMLTKELPHVVILGGGFAGLAAAKALRDAKVRITLIDKTNHHLFQPLLYQVAAAALAAPDISAPIRKLLSKQSNVTIWMSAIKRIDVTKKRIVLESTETTYDYLIVATGMTHAYFGFDSWVAHAPGLKTIGEALDIRRRILRAFECAELASSPEERRAWTTFVVIGGGPTGVELGGAIAEIAGRTLARDFRSFDPRTTRVILVEAGPRVLPTFSQHLSTVRASSSSSSESKCEPAPRSRISGRSSCRSAMSGSALVQSSGPRACVQARSHPTFKPRPIARGASEFVTT